MQEFHIPLNVAIIGIIALLAFFNAVILYFKKNNNRQADYFLVGFFLSLSIGYLLQIPHYGQYLKQINWKIMALPFSFTATAFLYFFVQSSLNKNFVFARRNYMFLIPFCVAVLFALSSIFNLISFELEEKITGLIGYLSTEIFIIWLVILNLFTIKKYKIYLSQNETHYYKNRYNWIRFIIYASLLFSIFPLIWGLISHLTDLTIKSQINYIVAGVVTISYLLLVLVKTTQNANNTIPISNEELNSVDENHFVKIATKEQIELFEKIENQLIDTKVYTDPDLNLLLLSQKMNEPKREVSKAINLCTKRNFYEFINDHRIEETQKILSTSQDQKLTIMEVMYEVGYNSKSSFNTAFKSRVGITPLQFRKNKLDEMSSNT